MAMESANKMKLLIVFLGILTGFTGCSNSPQKKQNSIASTTNKNAPLVLTLVDTSQYIPQRSMDKETAQQLPYQAVANPYLKQPGRIDAPLISDFIYARRAYQDGNFKDAKEALNRLTSKNNTLSGPWLMLGNIAIKETQPEQAIKYYTKAININKNNVNTYIHLAKIQRKQGEFIAAQNTYRNALAVWKDFPEAHLNLAILYDIYLNKPLKSQRHLEAYLFLIGTDDKKRSLWLKEIQQRTGKSIQLKAEKHKAISVKSG